MTESVHPVLAAAATYRQELLRNEDAAIRRLVVAYGTAYQRMGAQIRALQESLNGEPMTFAQAAKMARLQALREQIVTEISRFAAVADNEMTQMTRQSIELALNHSTGLVEAYFTSPQARQALQASFTQLVPEQIETMIGFTAPDSPLRQSLVGQLGINVADHVADNLIQGMVLGFNPNKTAAIIRRELGVGLSWAINTVRTANLYSYREATRANYVANSRVVSGWRWYATLDRRVCGSCLSKHGTLHDLSETLNGHHQCRCLTSGQMVITDRGEKPIESIVIGDKVLTHQGRYRTVTAISAREHNGAVYTFTQNGASVTTTPEHPLLTQRGWVEAKDCNAFDTFSTLNDIPLRASNRNTVQPNSASLASFFLSIDRFLGALCHFGSHSTANLVAGNAKSILYPSIANCGTQINPALSSAVKNSNSLGEQNSRQLICRLRAMVADRLADVSALNERSIRNSRSVSHCRLAAMLGETGSKLWSFIHRMSVRVLMPSSEQIWRYVAFSSMYRRLSHCASGSPSFDSISASNLDDMSSPHFWGSLFSPRAFARCKTALCDLPGINLAMSWCSMVSKLAIMIASSSFVQKYINNPFAKNNDNYGIIIHQQGERIKKSSYSGTVYNLQVDEDESYIAGGIVVHNCAMIPELPMAKSLGIDLPEIEPGESWFRRQDEGTQSTILGPGMLAAWRDGAVQFGQFSQPYHNDVYGEMLRMASMRELGLQEYYQR